VPGDFSSAAFFLAAALMVPGSELLIENVGVNPTRTGLLQALRRMGARVELLDERELFGEPVADLLVRYSGPLKATDIEPQEVPLMVDEIPVFSVLAATAQGTSTIKGAQELRLKESDRLSAMAQGLARMGIKVEEYPDGLSIQGGGLKGATLESFGDHRVAMAFSVAALAAEGTSSIEGAEAVEVSYPDFYQTLRRLLR
jgi:3-phosphoshikimate 1-carboxyvinyltransferase